MSLDNFAEQGRRLNIGEELILRLGNNNHKFIVEENINLSGFNQGSAYFVDTISVNDMSQFAVAARSEISIVKVQEYFGYCRDPEIRKYLQEIIDSGFIRPIAVSEFNGNWGYHAGASIFQGTSKVDEIRRSGQYGSIERVSYFGNNPEIALSHGLGDFNKVTERGTIMPEAKVLFITHDIEKLRLKRNIFIDPESLLPAFTQEFGTSFVVHNGFPVSSIKSIDVLGYQGYNK
jgi:hypothetical protein